MNFKEWKLSFYKDKICNKNNLNLWFNLRDIEYNWDKNYLLNFLKKNNNQLVCKQVDNKIYLISYFLQLNVKDLLSRYAYKIYSLSTIEDIVYEEYFKIFGNVCKILEYNDKIMEYIVPKSEFKKIGDKIIYIQKIRIFATVETIWKENRASIKISKFFKGKNFNKYLMIPEIKYKNFRKLPRTFSYGYLSKWESEQYHEKIIDYFVNNKPKNLKNPRLVLIFGLPGSGKNWVLKKRQKKNHVIINMDDCRALLPKYWESIISQTSGDWIRFFHDECNEITCKLFNYAIKNRMHIVWNGTGKNDKKYLSIIKTAKKNNYIVELNYVWVPFNTAKSRVKKRMFETGRNVPDSIINKAKEKIPSNFSKLLVNTDYARIYENQSKSPKMIWDKQQGWVEKEYLLKRSFIF